MKSNFQLLCRLVLLFGGMLLALPSFAQDTEFKGKIGKTLEGLGRILAQAGHAS